MKRLLGGDCERYLWIWTVEASLFAGAILMAFIGWEPLDGVIVGLGCVAVAAFAEA